MLLARNSTETPAGFFLYKLMRVHGSSISQPKLKSLTSKTKQTTTEPPISASLMGATHSAPTTLGYGVSIAFRAEKPGNEQPSRKGLRRLIAGLVMLLSVPFTYLLSGLRKLFVRQPKNHRLPLTADETGTGPGSGGGWSMTYVAMMVGQLMYLSTTLLSPALRHPFIACQLERLGQLADPYRTLTFDEYEGGSLMSRRRSSTYEEIKAYLSAWCVGNARHLRAESAAGRDEAIDKLWLSLVDGQKVSDQLFQGAMVWWHAQAETPPRADGAGHEKRRQLTLRYHDRYHEFVNDTYLPRVRREGRDLIVKSRQRKLFTNMSTHQWRDGGYMRSAWSHVEFEHPKTFATLAMDPAKKKEIMDDLDKFKNGKDYYARVGKAWKRGYLLYGPPGTGKSTMIAAMANYLGYDIYDIELTSVDSNADLRKLLIETTRKSIVVIEDIDCSLDLTGARKKKKLPAAGNGNDGASTSAAGEQDTSSRMTLSGLLNVIDGLWSCCGDERIFVFTTNHVEKLDTALIRPGRMDKHILMTYCCVEAFKSLAKMYLDVDAHPLFDAVEELLREVEMTTANVAEHLTPKSWKDNPDSCLAALVKALEEAAKEKANGGNVGQDDEQ